MSTIKYPTVWTFGDSLTERYYNPDFGCWGSIIANRLVRKCDLIQRGFSGYTTRMFKTMLPRLFTTEDASRAKAVVIFFGANDCALPAGKQHVPLDEYVANLNLIFDYFEKVKFPLKNAIVLTPPPFDPESWYKDGTRSYERNVEAPKQYAIACLKAATDRNIIAINLHEELSKRDDWKSLFVDGLHLNRAGGDAVADILWSKLSPMVDSLPIIFPEWRDLNMDNSEEVLKWEPPRKT